MNRHTRANLLIYLDDQVSFVFCFTFEKYSVLSARKKENLSRILS